MYSKMDKNKCPFFLSGVISFFLVFWYFYVKYCLFCFYFIGKLIIEVILEKNYTNNIFSMPPKSFAIFVLQRLTDDCFFSIVTHYSNMHDIQMMFRLNRLPLFAIRLANKKVGNGFRI